MKYRWGNNRYLQWGVTAFLVIAASMLFYYGIFHMKTLLSGIRRILTITAPIIYGFAIAYVLSAVVNFLERSVIYPFLKKRDVKVEEKGARAIRWICVIFSLVMLTVIIYGLIMMVLPQLIRSIMNVIYSFPEFVNSAEKWLSDLVEKSEHLDAQSLQTLDTYSSQFQNYLTTTILPQLQDMLKNVSSGFIDILIFLKNFVIGMIISAYLLADKEKFTAKVKMILYAVLPVRHANFLIRTMRFTNRVFGGFFSGKLLDSAIIGVLCYILMTLLNMPYTILVSVIVGVTNIIPFFGPYLGAIPCILLILLVDPIKGLYFILMILLLQQFDGNILGPKILGESTGLSSFMVIVAILVGGGLFGVVGMLVGVPVAAVIYAGVEKLLTLSLQKKKVPTQEESYFEIDSLDPETKEIRPRIEEHPVSERRERLVKANTLLMKILVFLEQLLKVAFAYIKMWAIRAYYALKQGFEKVQSGTKNSLKKQKAKIDEHTAKIKEKMKK